MKAMQDVSVYGPIKASASPKTPSAQPRIHPASRCAGRGLSGNLQDFAVGDIVGASGEIAWPKPKGRATCCTSRAKWERSCPPARGQAVGWSVCAARRAINTETLCTEAHGSSLPVKDLRQCFWFRLRGLDSQAADCNCGSVPTARNAGDWPVGKARATKLRPCRRGHGLRQPAIICRGGDSAAVSFDGAAASCAAAVPPARAVALAAFFMQYSEQPVAGELDCGGISS